MEYSTRIMQIEDLPEVVRIHLLSFSGFFLTFLGPSFLHELYYGVLKDPTGIAFISVSETGAPAGFVTGTTRPKDFYQRLIRERLFQFGFAALPAAIKKPLIIPRLFRALSAPKNSEVEEACGTLISIAVNPALQRHGIGKQLVVQFLNEAGRRGLQQVRLTTNRLENDPANQFYLSLGFHLHTDFTTPEGRQMNEYRINLVADKKSIDDFHRYS